MLIAPSSLMDTVVKVVLVICVGFDWRLLVWIFVFSRLPHSAGLSILIRAMGQALRVIAQARLKMNQPFSRGLRDASLSSYLFSYQLSLANIMMTTYGNCVEQSCFVSVVVQPSQISSSNLH